MGKKDIETTTHKLEGLYRIAYSKTSKASAKIAALRKVKKIYVSIYKKQMPFPELDEKLNTSAA